METTRPMAMAGFVISIIALLVACGSVYLHWRNLQVWSAQMDFNEHAMQVIGGNTHGK